MTNAQKKKAEKKADLALCKVQDLFYDLDITDPIARAANDACNAIRSLLSAIENAETTRN